MDYRILLHIKAILELAHPNIVVAHNKSIYTGNPKLALFSTDTMTAIGTISIFKEKDDNGEIVYFINMHEAKTPVNLIDTIDVPVSLVNELMI